MNVTASLRAVALDATRRASRALAALNLTMPQYEFLDVIEQNPGIHSADVARACAVTPQSAWATVSNLVGLGLIQRIKVKGGGHLYPYEATEHGKETVQRARLVMGIVDTYYNDKLGADACAAIASMADTVKVR